MFEKDSIVIGILLGIFLPIVGFAIWLEIYDQLEASGIISGAGADEMRRRTSALLGLCVNLIPFARFNKNKFFNSMRGIMIPTFIYVGVWLYFFGWKLLEFS